LRGRAGEAGVSGRGVQATPLPPSFARRPPPQGGREPAAASDTATTNIVSLVAAFKSSGAKLACLCSSDDIYTHEAADAAKALAAAGAKHIYLAGRPKDTDALKAAGVGSFIFAGGDAVAILKSAHDILGT
jgi:methylmalonyl-CoA mutase